MCPRSTFSTHSLQQISLKVNQFLQISCYSLFDGKRFVRHKMGIVASDKEDLT